MNLTSFIAHVSNNTFVISELLILGFIGYWATQQKAPETRIILTAWALVAVGYLIRIGYWSVAMFMSPVEPAHYVCTLDLTVCELKSEPFPEWAVQYRAWLIIPSLMVIAGNTLFLATIEARLQRARGLVIGTGVLAASAFAAAGYGLAEAGELMPQAPATLECSPVMPPN